MKDGVVQQVDSPQNLYERPKNLFVAGFMGSPQMNLRHLPRLPGMTIELLKLKRLKR